jgi:hypothetical protein
MLTPSLERGRATDTRPGRSPVPTCTHALARALGAYEGLLLPSRARDLVDQTEHCADDPRRGLREGREDCDSPARAPTLRHTARPARRSVPRPFREGPGVGAGIGVQGKRGVRHEKHRACRPRRRARAPDVLIQGSSHRRRTSAGVRRVTRISRARYPPALRAQTEAPCQSIATTGSSPTTQASWPGGSDVISPGPDSTSVPSCITT